MSKTLSIILKIFKVSRIVAKVVFILCIVGGVGSILGIVSFPNNGEVMGILFAEEQFYSISTRIIEAIFCAGEAVVAFFAEKYFAQVVSAGTPFTLEGSKKCLNFGFISIIASLAVSTAAGVVFFIGLLFSPDAVGFDAETSLSLTTGLLFIFMSFIFKYGAELTAPTAETSEETKQEVRIEAENTEEKNTNTTEQI